MTWISHTDDAGHYAVIISAVDGSSDTNPGYTAGWKWDGESSASTRSAPLPLDGNELDIEKLDDAGLIFEVDNALPEADISVTPSRVDDRLETESRYPFVHIEFNGLKDDEGDDSRRGRGIQRGRPEGLSLAGRSQFADRERHEHAVRSAARAG